VGVEKSPGEKETGRRPHYCSAWPPPWGSSNFTTSYGFRFGDFFYDYVLISASDNPIYHYSFSMRFTELNRDRVWQHRGSSLCLCDLVEGQPVVRQREQAILRVRFQVLTASSMKMTAFWDMASYSLIEVNRRLRSAYCLRHQGDGGSIPLKRRPDFYESRLHGAMSLNAVILILRVNAENIRRIIQCCSPNSPSQMFLA
jgi:hypothetical protein